ncbi:hypothetical protein BCR37DRAFT_376320 [Protomyces lactucae-debilis]|uniref:Uncharacterized protein n=1 Tax=Protomyces lactucae-debilis TaxID=2754530 RepID=A0A1Y2FSJ8_PROLT|nr:uncharacterized protein BCR37DRAFT_376320 [Protomyces lactucae-debilis]ORY86982.1 hypothetical protein BCR37DRAFT_376320 [Protomyces lactucae-debilis]
MDGPRSASVSMFRTALYPPADARTPSAMVQLQPQPCRPMQHHLSTLERDSDKLPRLDASGPTGCGLAASLRQLTVSVHRLSLDHAYGPDSRYIDTSQD